MYMEMKSKWSKRERECEKHESEPTTQWSMQYRNEWKGEANVMEQAMKTI